MYFISWPFIPFDLRTIVNFFTIKREDLQLAIDCLSDSDIAKLKFQWVQRIYIKNAILDAGHSYADSKQRYDGFYNNLAHPDWGAIGKYSKL